MFTRYLLGAAFAAVSLTAVAADRPENKVTVVFDQPLPNAPGKSMKVVIVDYAPGGGSPAHTHPKSAFIYATVLEGAVRSQVNDGPAKVYQVGEHFIEEPGSHHGVSENASKTAPSKLMAVFVLDSDSKEQLVTPAK